MPAQWRHSVVVLLAFVLGAAVGGGVVLGWPAIPGMSGPAPPPLQVDEHAVRLVLLSAVPAPTHPRGRGCEHSPLHVDGALFLAGTVASTVVGVDSLDRSVDVRVAGLPVTVSPAARIQSVTLEIIVRDCTAAGRWRPLDRPFTISWRDEAGKRHLDRAGDFDRSMSRSLVRYVDAVCDAKGPSITRSGRSEVAHLVRPAAVDRR